MKHLEKAFSFLIHIFRAAEKMRPRDEFWHMKGLGFDYYINEKHAHKIGVEEIYELFSTLPDVRNERLN